LLEEFVAVRFELARVRIEEIASALRANERAAYEAVFRNALLEDRVRRDTSLAHFEQRQALCGALGDDPLAAIVRRAPATVRRTFALAALREAQRLRALSAIGAPQVVLGATRANVERAVAALDPSVALLHDEPPPLVEDFDGAIHVHAWLERVLERSRDPETLRTERVDLDVPETIETDPMRSGIESTAFSMLPSRALWLPLGVALPHLLDDGRTVVGEAGGPLTYAWTNDRATVSFLWRDTSQDIPWDER
jgi:hypothetical protein